MFFKRYTWPAKRAIYFARVLTVLSEQKRISSVDLLCGLMFDEDSRAQSIFNLREHFPTYKGYPWKFADLPKPKREPALDYESRQIIAWTAAEATRMGDYWIDTEHLLLGILRVPRCTAAQYLNRAGLSLRTTRETIRQNKSSRPDYGAVPRFWPIRSKVRTLIFWGWP